jgi:hypothetical protein
VLNYWNKIQIFVRPKDPKLKFGPNYGGAQIAMRNLQATDQDFIVIPVKSKISAQAITYFTHPRGIIFQRPKQKYAETQYQHFVEYLLSTHNSNIADMWNDHTGMEDTNPFSITPRSWVKEYLRKSKHILHIVVEDKIADELINLGADPRSIRVIPVNINPLFLKTDNKMNDELRYETFSGASPEDLVIIAHDRISPEKHADIPVHLALQLKKLIPASYPHKIFFIIIGNYLASDYGINIYNHVKEAGFFDPNSPIKILMPGWFENKDLPRILSQADISMGFHQEPPHISQAWGMSFAECWALGLPVITWSNKLDPLQQGLLNLMGSFLPYQTEQNEEFYEKIAQIIMNYANMPLEKRRATRQEIRTKALELFNFEENTRQIKQLFPVVSNSYINSLPLLR